LAAEYLSSRAIADIDSVDLRKHGSAQAERGHDRKEK
jgi:hypothetical protein